MAAVRESIGKSGPSLSIVVNPFCTLMFSAHGPVSRSLFGEPPLSPTHSPPST